MTVGGANVPLHPIRQGTGHSCDRTENQRKLHQYLIGAACKRSPPSSSFSSLVLFDVSFAFVYAFVFVHVFLLECMLFNDKKKNIFYLPSDFLFVCMILFFLFFFFLVGALCVSFTCSWYHCHSKHCPLAD